MERSWCCLGLISPIEPNLETWDTTEYRYHTACTDRRICLKKLYLYIYIPTFLMPEIAAESLQRKRPLDLFSCFLFRGPVNFFSWTCSVFFLFLGPVQCSQEEKTTPILTRVTLLYFDEASSSWISVFWYVRFNFDLTSPRLVGLDVYADAAVGV